MTTNTPFTGLQELRVMPYLVLDRVYEVGDVIFWPHRPRGRMGIADGNTRKSMRSILQRAVSPHAFRRITAQTLVYHGHRGNLAPLSAEQNEDVDSATLVLMCAVLAARPKLQCTAENFAMVRWNMNSGSGGTIGHEHGSLLRSMSIVAPGFRHSWDVAPPHVDLPQRPLEVSEGLLAAIAAFTQQAKRGREQLRLIDGLRWLRFACSNDDTFSEGARVIAMVTAFEFILPKFNNRVEFAEKLEATCASMHNGDRKVGATVQLRGNDYRALDLTRVGWWAYDFYGLRSRIAHGSHIVAEDYQTGRKGRHSIVSVSVFLECLKCRLEQLGLYRHTPADCHYWSRMLNVLWPRQAARGVNARPN